MADSPDPEIVRLAARIFEHRLRVVDVMAETTLSRGTWYRWKSGGDPRLSEIRQVDRAIDKLIAEKEQPHGAPNGKEAEARTAPER